MRRQSCCLECVPLRIEFTISVRYGSAGAPSSVAKRLPRAPGRARVRGMTNQIHGHEVMQMMVEAQTAYSVESLKAAIIGKFGADARFYTCSADNLTADELIDLLAQRGKFVAQADGFSTSADKICKH